MAAFGSPLFYCMTAWQTRHSGLIPLFRMLSRLFGNRPKRTPTIPAGQRVYAIGDIHGRVDLLEQILACIDSDNRSREVADTQIIFLGDLIDRGPHSARVVELVQEVMSADARYRCLLGNHEEIFLTAMCGDLEALKLFTRVGGKETILSYGVSEEDYLAADYSELLELLKHNVPEEHVRFLSSLEDMIVAGDYAFVHAGVRPGVALANQSPKELRWIRREFLSYNGTFDKVIVHGHTISSEIEEKENRIGLDTGAYATGVLSAMGFSNADRWRIQTKV